MENAEMPWSVDTDAEQPVYAADADTDLPVVDELVAFADDTPPEVGDFAEAEAQCPTCGELLAWHDEFASCHPASPAAWLPLAPAPVDEFSQEPAAEASAEPRLASRLAGQAGRATFAYEVGRRVQPTPALTAEVIWRGQLKERHPATGLVHRVNVYRLNDGFWDCYREDDLQAA